MGDRSGRRGHILGTEPLGDGNGSAVKAIVPMAELHLYATRLQSLTHGYGAVSYRMHGFEQAPAEVVQQVVKAQEKEA